MRPFLVIIALLFFIEGSAQPGARVAEKLKQISLEQIYVHTDKDAYVAGETVYFKAYILSGLYPSTYSSSFFIQLYSDSGLITKKVFPVISGISVGTFTLPLTLTHGRYIVTGYTNTSVKEGDLPTFISPLFVYNPLSPQLEHKKYQPLVKASVSYTQGMPIAGLPNQIFISTLDQYNQPQVENGQLMEDEGKVVVTFQTNEAGRAVINFVPAAGIKYHLAFANPKIEKLPIDPFAKEGTSMVIKSDGKSYAASIYTTPAGGNQKLFLVLEHQNRVLLTAPIAADQQVSRLNFPINTLPSGVIRFALVNEKEEAVAEQFVFSNNIEVVAANKVSFVSNSDLKQESLSASFLEKTEGTVSARLYDGQNFLTGMEKDENIVNRLLFSSHLKYPFSYVRGLIGDLQTADIHLINSILATSALNKPSWNSLVTQPAVVLTGDSSFIQVEGIAKPRSKKGLPKESNLNVIVKTSDSAQAFFTVPIKDDGSFKLGGMMFTDSAALFYQLNSKKTAEKEVDVILNAHSIMDMPTYGEVFKDVSMFFKPLEVISKDAPRLAQQLYKHTIDSLQKATMLSEIIVKTTRTRRDEEKEVERRYVTGMFTATSNRTINFVTEPPISPWVTLISYLRRSYSQRFMVSDNGIFAFNSLARTAEYAYFLDEVSVGFNSIKNMTLNEIAIIKIFHSGAGVSFGNTPTIAIYSRRHRDMKQDENFNAVKVVYLPGYSTATDFLLPRTSNEATSPQYSSTFYWNPYLLIDSDRKMISVSAFAPKNLGKTQAIIEGFASDGRFIYINTGQKN